MINSVVLESWHKFVYYDDSSKNKIYSLIGNYPVKVNSSTPIVVYINDEGLPKPSSDISLDNYRIEIFHQRYYEILILLSIVDRLICEIDRDTLNNRFKRVFRLLSLNNEKEIDDICELGDILEKTKNIYKKEYINYINTGVLGNFYNDLEIPFVVIDSIISSIKKSIGLEKHFSLLIDIDSDLSIFNQRTINDYIASRCTSYLTINVLLNKYNWKCFYNNSGLLIENIHDYIDVDLRENYIKKRKKD